MKVSIKIIVLILVTLITLFLIGLGIYFYRSPFVKEPDGLSIDNVSTFKAIVVKVYEKSLGVMDIQNTKELYSVSFANDGNIGFKQGQEVLIYFDGMIAQSYPAQIHNVNKIEIIKEKSDVAIPDDVLQYYYNSTKNVTISLTELTKTRVSLTINDTNENPYNYDNIYCINKKNKKAENNNVDLNQISKAPINATPSYVGGSLEVIWEEAPRISNISSEKTLVFEDNSNKNTFIKSFDWSSIYGELESGEYEFVLSAKNFMISNIRFNFEIKENGEIFYYKPTLGI